MKRFTISLDDEIYEKFANLFPGYGLRQAFLRRIIKRTLGLVESKDPAEIDKMLNQEIDSIDLMV